MGFINIKRMRTEEREFNDRGFRTYGDEMPRPPEKKGMVWERLKQAGQKAKEDYKRLVPPERKKTIGEFFQGSSQYYNFTHRDEFPSKLPVRKKR